MEREVELEENFLIDNFGLIVGENNLSEDNMKNLYINFSDTDCDRTSIEIELEAAGELIESFVL